MIIGENFPLPRFTGYYIDNALECKAKYLLLVDFLKILKFFIEEKNRRQNS